MNGRWAGCLIAAIHFGLAGRGWAEFGFDDVRARAAALAAQPYRDSYPQVPATWMNLPPAKYAGVHFDDRKARWREEKLPFALEFYPPGIFHKQIVIIHEIDPRGVREIPFDPGVFIGPDPKVQLPTSPGYAGFRIERIIPNGLDEMATFLDACYFRMIGIGETFGSSARGIGLNTGAAGPEEFPVFREFWIRHPQAGDSEVTVYALMDSPSVTGAYRFIIRPGPTTVAEVKMTAFLRRVLQQLEFAPLTSMFLFGENSHPPFGDVRPQVHDADGLLIHNGRGEWIWHPLETGKGSRLEAFQDQDPQGFGLIQRDRVGEHFEDLDDRYESRPSVWVQPVGRWGDGAVRLVQFASDQDSVDNVAAFWVPAIPLQAGQHLGLDYELHWTSVDPSPSALGQVQATHIGRSAGNPPHLQFAVDFGGPAVTSIPNTEQLAADIGYGPGVELVTQNLQKNPRNQTWRLLIEIADPHRVVNLRAHLKHNGRPITESWNYTWQP